MIKRNSQLKDIFRISFNVKYCNIILFEEFFAEKASSISIYELKSNTIDSQADDVWCFEAYLNKKLSLNSLKAQIQRLIKFHDIEDVSNITIEQIEDKDWVAFYQSQIKPIETNKFFICTKLHIANCPINKIPLLIEASRAFGTGEHETTKGCIEALEYLSSIKVISNILDIGTGTGILSFAAERLWPQAQIFACDIDEVAVNIAQENAKFNTSSVKFYQNVESKILFPSHNSIKFNLIIGNILALPLISFAAQIKKIADEECYLILSGFLEYQSVEVINTYQQLGFKLKQTLHKNSWVILILQFCRNNH